VRSDCARRTFSSAGGLKKKAAGGLLIFGPGPLLFVALEFDETVLSKHVEDQTLLLVVCKAGVQWLSIG
jgi:hypothetical protein